MWLTKHYELGRMSAVLVAFAPTVPPLVAAWWSYQRDHEEAALDLSAVAQMLADLVKASETEQRAQLLAGSPHRIPVSCTWSDPADPAVERQGDLSGVLAFYEGLQHRRLVVTGASGAGKTVLAIELLLQQLRQREGGAVPLRMPLADWDLGLPFEDWVADYVMTLLQGRGVKRGTAVDLVRARLILPVLDGLDEMDTEATPVAERRAARALSQLNRYHDIGGGAAIILTCRTEQYDELGTMDLRLQQAVRIRVNPVDSEQMCKYFEDRSDNPQRWQPVLDAIRTARTGTLAQALNTPWRLNLAATVYERDPHTLTYTRDPAELLSFAAPSDVRDHLLRHFIPASAEHHPTSPKKYPPHLIHRGLAAFAGHLRFQTCSHPGCSHSDSSSLFLHRLWPIPGRNLVRLLDVVFLLPFLAALFLVVPPYLSFDSIMGSPVERYALTLLIAVIIGWEGVRDVFTLRDRYPVSVPMRKSGSTARIPEVRYMIFTFTGMVALGGLLGWAIAKRSSDQDVPPIAATHTATVLLSLFLALLLCGFCRTIIGLRVTRRFLPSGTLLLVDRDENFIDPRDQVKGNLAAGILVAAGVPASIGVAHWSGGLFPPSAHGATDLQFASYLLLLGVFLGFFNVASASRRFLLFTLGVRVRRILPLRVARFMHWSYQAGLLRVAGSSYQFRHRELQDWLARNPSPVNH
ncbi:hypothetical protein AB0L74_03505 [Streptomyces sp. NPDC052020]|uniref:NACHT domain-containing protein n=1 Tax=Streptomyces sp. NPDC052020 TaxID=3155677 RepID=UPI0034451B46